jgi:aminopeptidase-like protein/aminoglycoside N3'-acetyltransferase
MKSTSDATIEQRVSEDRGAPAWTAADLEAALRRVGIGDGDTVFFQVCGETLGPAEGASSEEELAALLYRALRATVGASGTILAPAYTFSFCKQQLFDVDATPTVKGPWNTLAAFPEYLRRLPGAVRSSDPIFSTAGIGPGAAELLTGLPSVCLGADSVHDRLRRSGGKIAILGVGLYEAIFRHHVEAVSRVPWRYDKLFTGWIREGGRERKAGWIYNVRIVSKNGDPAGQSLEDLARRAGVCRAASVGRGELVGVDAGAFFELAARELERDPWSTARGPAADPIALEEARTGGPAAPAPLPENASMEQIVDGLWALPRDILSNGFDAALGALARQVPMTIHEYPTGTQCWTWIIPEKWTCHEAWLETLDGRRLFSYADHPLHVVSYSLPFEGIVTREELLRHLHVSARIPDAIPFIFKYYERDWGLCCSQKQRDALTDEKYRVVIRTSFSYANLKLAEIVIPGASEESIVLTSHLCHPHMVNDDMTGVAVMIDVARALRKKTDLRYTYRLLIVPETIGTVAYLSHRPELIPKMKGGLFLEMLGKSHPHSLQSSLTGKEEVDLCFEAALRERDPEGWIGPYRMVIGNDERQFNGPGVRVPYPSISRVLPGTHPDHPYREYHSSHDDPSIITGENLRASRDLILRMLEILEQNRTPVNLFQGEVFCARYGIFRNWYTDREAHRALFSTMHLIDGTRSLVEIAREADVSFFEVHRAVQELESHGLVKFL